MTHRGRVLAAIGAVAVTAAVWMPSTALAESKYPAPTPPSSTGPSQARDPGTSQAGSASAGTGSLPFTGGDIMGLAFMGAVAAGGGVALARSGRRRTDA